MIGSPEGPSCAVPVHEPTITAGAGAIPLRVIPRLDIKGPNLVKGVHLEGLRVLGKPERFARYYYEHGADELLFMDVVASLYGRNTLLDLITRTASEVFIPLIVGGGLRSIDDIRAVLRAGADKVSLNTSAIDRPEFVREAAHRFGSSTIVVSIEAVRTVDGTYEACTDGGRERTGRDVFEWAEQATELGAGELLVTSIDQEGTGRGYDLELTRRIARAVPIPVIASGGAGNMDHVAAVASEAGAQGAAVASILHYWVAQHVPAEQEEYGEGINLSHVTAGRGFARVHETSLAELKRHLVSLNIRGRDLTKTVVC